jgi:hypothetical protein
LRDAATVPWPSAAVALLSVALLASLFRRAVAAAGAVAAAALLSVFVRVLAGRLLGVVVQRHLLTVVVAGR